MLVNSQAGGMDGFGEVQDRDLFGHMYDSLPGPVLSVMVNDRPRRLFGYHPDWPSPPWCDDVVRLRDLNCGLLAWSLGMHLGNERIQRNEVP